MLDTLANVKTALMVSGSTDDALLNRLMDGADAFVWQHTGRDFAGGTFTETHPAGSEVLFLRNFPVTSLKPLASARSAGKTIRFRGREVGVEELTPESFKGVEIAFFSAGGSVSREFAPAAVEAGAVVIDNTSAFRMKAGIPLVVPEVNPQDLRKHPGLIANPNCSTIIMNVPVWPLHQRFKVKRIVVSPGHALSLQRHQRRAEHWVVVSGTARVTRDAEVYELGANQSTFIPVGARHRLENPGAQPLQIIEIQSGDYLGEDDIERFEDRYDRA